MGRDRDELKLNKSKFISYKKINLFKLIILL